MNIIKTLKDKIINHIKYNKYIFLLYSFLGGIGLRIIKLFTKQDQKLILFTCFGGRKFDDSSRAIYEAMILDKRFDDYNIVWAFREPDLFQISRGKKIKIDSFSFYKHMYKAKVWVSNSGMERGLFFNAKNVYNLNTWHGTPIKKIGNDTHGSAFGQKKGTPTNAMLAQSDFEADTLSKAFGINRNIYKVVGYPRNDEIASVSLQKQNDIKGKLGVPMDKKIILYAPTYREFDRDKNNNCVLAPPINLNKWKEYLGDRYFLLFRAHYEVAKVMNIIDDDFVKNVSSYPSMNELMIASDILISDYSSVFFDYSILARPMFVFTYDYERYVENRGVYFDIRKELDDFSSTEDEIIIELNNYNEAYRINIAKKFREKYVSVFGNASKSALDLIFEEITSK